MRDKERVASLIRPHTKTDGNRIRFLLNELERIEREQVEGDLVECGVWKGGNVAAFRLMCPSRRAWAYDTFAGMTEPSAYLDGEKANRYYRRKVRRGVKMTVASMDTFRSCLREAGADPDAVVTVEGDVRVTLCEPRNLPDKVAVLRVDVDWWAATDVCLRKLAPRVAPGGITIIDDYGHWEGCKRATDEFFGLGHVKLLRPGPAAYVRS